ncbi:MAG: hypothetical protein APF84_05925 [Gracilibacter sp. BRH_c7a]|nr:MAG: hypothetical protein APF84_05925 [Gracilibacter sp. BRH_c7a]
MEKIELKGLLGEANNGNELARERIILHYKPFILNTAGHISKRYLTWSDEESSIALIAFNRAIDTYDPQGGRTFLNYVYLLINRDLIDYSRREKRNYHLSLDPDLDQEDHTLHTYEVVQSVDSYQRTIETMELVEEILELDQTLNQFNISFEELEYYSPQHRDTRSLLFTMAERFVEDEECVKIFLDKKRLPVSLFTSKTGYHTKTIDRHRKYLITLILLRLNPQWVQLAEFIQEGTRIGNEGLS